MTGKEIFEMLYDGKIANDECIEAKYVDDEDDCGTIFYCYDDDETYSSGNGDNIMSYMLDKKYTFKIIKQEEILKRLQQKIREESIKRLEEQLKFLKGEE